MQYFTQSLLIAAIAIIAPPRASSTQGQWQRITDREAGFTISFPGKPSYEQSADPTLPHQTETYKFFYNDRLLQITFAPLVKQPRTPAELGDAFSEITRVQARDGKLLRQVKLPDGGRQYDNVTTDKNGIAYHRTRVYIRSGRYYAISYSMYATDSIDEHEAERFFSSLRFTDDLPANRAAVRRGTSRRSTNNAQRNSWYTFRSPDGDFTVDFPGRPEFKEFPNPDTHISDYKYYFNYGENTFIVSYREEPLAAAQPKRVLQQALEKALENNGVWHVLQHIQMNDGGHYIESQGMAEGIPIYMRTKLYLRGTRLYHVSTMTQNLIGPNKDDVVRFLSSFRLL
jgi:hypothetical protein